MPDSRDPWGEEKPRPDPRKLIKQGGPNGDELSSAFKWSFFPILGLSLVSLFGFLTEPIYYLWFIGVIGVIAVALIGLVMGLAALVGRPEDKSRATAAGVLAGAAVGIIALAVTCFINLATWNVRLGAL